MKRYLMFTAVAAVVIIGCVGKKGDSRREGETAELSDSTVIRTDAEVKGEELTLLAESAVDAWFYEHLNDYGSFKPLRRATEYDAATGLYRHRCLYRASNTEGGLETHEKEFEVELVTVPRPGGGFTVKRHEVRDLSGWNGTEGR